ncbi:MAG TPA: hypothetical protein DDY68_03120, partial [Porphyromonadaceae bacterium]|nr:hypothetical protein [Porphyromonadaceae bacterium]
KWQEEYYIWDCAAGTGNLLVGLNNVPNLYASTLDKADVDIMKERTHFKSNLLENHIFQFDFLNDSFDKLPKSLQDIIHDEKKRKKLVIYINPPYAEATTATTITGTGKNKGGVSNNTMIFFKYEKELGKSLGELFVQFLIRIYKELPSCWIAHFSTLKILQSPNSQKFRKVFQSKLEKGFVVPSSTFDNVNGDFPIGFMVWNTQVKEAFKEKNFDVYDCYHNADHPTSQTKCVFAESKTINQWLKEFTLLKPENEIFAMCCKGTDFQNQRYVNINFRDRLKGVGNAKGVTTFGIGAQNLIPSCIYLSVRHCVEANWLNDRDQFLYPEEGWKKDKEFQNDCLIYTIFHGQNNISCKEGVNHWIPFSEQEVRAKERFESHFMHDFISGKMQMEEEEVLFEGSKKKEKPVPLEFSAEAKEVLNAGRELWKYYHSKEGIDVNASFYDIKEYFQGRNEKGKMKSKSEDSHYMELIKTLRESIKVLGDKIAKKVYQYGFLK